MSLMKRLLQLNVLFKCGASFAEIEAAYLGVRKKLVLCHLYDHNNSGTVQETKQTQYG